MGNLEIACHKFSSKKYMCMEKTPYGLILISNHQNSYKQPPNIFILDGLL